MYSTYDATSEPSSPAFTRSSCGSPVDEARNLVQRCAEPRPVGDSVKSAINRAAKRLGFTNSRTKDLWYAEAHRIDAVEMDRLRKCAIGAEIDQSVVALEVLRERLSQVPSDATRELINGIDAALRVLGRRPSEHDLDARLGGIDEEK